MGNGPLLQIHLSLLTQESCRARSRHSNHRWLIPFSTCSLGTTERVTRLPGFYDFYGLARFDRVTDPTPERLKPLGLGSAATRRILKLANRQAQGINSPHSGKFRTYGLFQPWRLDSCAPRAGTPLTRMTPTSMCTWRCRFSYSPFSASLRYDVRVSFLASRSQYSPKRPATERMSACES